MIAHALGHAWMLLESQIYIHDTCSADLQQHERQEVKKTFLDNGIKRSEEDMSYYSLLTGFWPCSWTIAWSNLQRIYGVSHLFFFLKNWCEPSQVTIIPTWKEWRQKAGSSAPHTYYFWHTICCVQFDSGFLVVFQRIFNYKFGLMFLACLQTPYLLKK